jgi:hypothetical protein
MTPVISDAMIERAVEAYHEAMAASLRTQSPESPGWLLDVFRVVLTSALTTAHPVSAPVDVIEGRG